MSLLEEDGGSVAVIDYGVGNLGSVGRALGRLRVRWELTADATRIRLASRIVLPGVGHFGESMRNLRGRGLEEPIRDAVQQGASLLGICVGFQMLFDGSEEDPGEPGLGFLEGRVKRFPEEALTPHIGWNQLEGLSGNGLLAGIEEGSYFYFLHSYYADPVTDEAVKARTEYEVEFCSVAQKGRVAGIQFHPEKSQALGLRVLQNFLSS